MGQSSRTRVGGSASNLEVRINARLQPVHRGDRYEDPLAFLLERRFPGSTVTGGGTLVSTDGEPLMCAIEAEVVGDLDDIADAVIDLLQSQGAPLGSGLVIDDGDPRGFGTTEGLALYLDGVGLAPSVYAENDVNVLLDDLHVALVGIGALQSFWEGPTETALYLYGASAGALRAALADLLTTHPLAENHRLVDLT